MQVTDLKKFIFPQKEFLSELYRNCLEHPKIADFLQNGEEKEKSIARKWIIFEEMGEEKLQFIETTEILEGEYGRMCIQKRKNSIR